MTRPTRRKLVLWSSVGLIGLIGLIVLAVSVIQHESGKTWIENPGALVGICISGMSGIMIAVLPHLIRSEEAVRETKATVDRVASDIHTGNVAALTRGDLDILLEAISEVRSDIRGIRRDYGRLASEQLEHGRRLTAGERRGDSQDRKLGDIQRRLGAE